MGERVTGIWAELRRRRVVSSAAAYLAVAFVVLQLAEILFPAFDLGPGALRILFAGLLGLFPVALALSWVYDVTGAGLTRTDDEVPNGGPHPVILAGVVLSAVALGGMGWWAVQSVDTSVAITRGQASIAVLPFADLSPERDQGYLGDGLAEEVLNILAGVSGLQVAARTSSFAFRENDDIRAIGRQLNVAYVLEGSVQRVGETVKVTGQLIDAGSGFHVWSESYEREARDLFALQDDIAQAIAQALLGELELIPRGGSGHVVPAVAQDLYYRGRAQWSRRDAVGIPEAIELFNRAISADSLYAEAYAGLADSWALMPQFVRMSDPASAMDRAEAFALRAIELNDQLAEAHSSLGLVRALRLDRIGALSAFGRAIEINPSYAPALHWRANVLADMGRLREAAADASRAASVDPLSAPIATDHGYVLLWLEDLQGADAEFERARSLEFGFAPALLGSALVALHREQDVRLQMSLTQWVAVQGLPMALATELGPSMAAYRASGQPQSPPPSLDRVALAGRLPAGTTAALYALVGADDEALTWLRASIQDRSWIDQYLRVNPTYDALRGHSEFQSVLEEIGA